jgi:hypothetical protein
LVKGYKTREEGEEDFAEFLQQQRSNHGFPKGEAMKDFIIVILVIVTVYLLLS